jgi:hypothetical protein
MVPHSCPLLTPFPGNNAAVPTKSTVEHCQRMPHFAHWGLITKIDRLNSKCITLSMLRRYYYRQLSHVVPWWRRTVKRLFPCAPMSNYSNSVNPMRDYPQEHVSPRCCAQLWNNPGHRSTPTVKTYGGGTNFNSLHPKFLICRWGSSAWFRVQCGGPRPNLK